MPSITSSKLTQPTSRILCYHFNSTHKMQLIRLWNGEKYSWEKIIFPQQRVLFAAQPQGILEVHTKGDGKLLEEIYSCCNLKINQSQPQSDVI